MTRRASIENNHCWSWNRCHLNSGTWLLKNWLVWIPLRLVGIPLWLVGIPLWLVGIPLWLVGISGWIMDWCMFGYEPWWRRSSFNAMNNSTIYLKKRLKFNSEFSVPGKTEYGGGLLLALLFIMNLRSVTVNIESKVLFTNVKFERRTRSLCATLALSNQEWVCVQV